MEVEADKGGDWREVVRELCIVEPKSLATGGGASRLFGKFVDAGLVRQVGPTRILTPVRNLELPRHGGVEAWHLFALFDCALEGGFPTVILDYVVQVSLDSQAVSSDPRESFLMNQSLVEAWCEEVALYLRREFHSLVETMDPRSQEFTHKGPWIEKVLSSLQAVFEVLAKPAASSAAGDKAPAFLRCSDQVTLVLEACKTCNWFCREGLVQMLPSSPRSKGRGGRSKGGKGSFIEDLLSELGLGPEVYPFGSFLDALTKIFLVDKGETSAKTGTLHGKKKAFLYYLIDIGCEEATVTSFAAEFDLTSAECAAIRAYCLVDSQDAASIDEACLIFPSITKQINHTKVIQALMALGRSQNALDIIRSRLDAGIFPTMEEALLSLECKGLYEGFLHCRELWEGATDDACFAIAEQCTRTWSERHGAKGKVLELPFNAKEETCLSDSALPLYLVTRRRYREAQEALKKGKGSSNGPDREMTDMLRSLIETAMSVVPAET
ncbi:ELYS domain-containing protein [Chloropicon primus]|uniref:ELYS-like domain-containing protein n=2 Tax=Chloropicon primus TaxID=1764295 RepID=A0A5B8MS77_9CHLO|nr:hypothetical protein A3770_07p47880 [Chloropicon primus]UPR01486.1 ELYS domain-containing protein [Chloropicon primus]|eukprot:QDZ22270.1 hypothetical protein A3770_07p47880 [Chloropicon primus]